MSSNDQPSILAVCVPGVAAEPGVLDLNQILAARERAAIEVQHLDAGIDCNSSTAKCDACDDSACGLDVTRDSSPDFAPRTCDNRRHGLSRGIGAGEMSSEANARESACGEQNNPSFFHADSGKKALELLRMLRFDLLVTGDQLPDMPVSHLIRRIRAASPWQKWAMVGSNITTQDEIAARTLGALAVFDAPPDWEVLGSLAAVAAGKAAAMANSSSAKIEHFGPLQIASSRAQPVSRRGDRAMRDRSAAVAGSRRAGVGALTGPSGGCRRGTILPQSASRRSVG